MKRFHVNVSEEDINESIRFYTALFATPPSVKQSDYAKWMLEDRRNNFAISQRGAAPGVNHVGLQVDTALELTAMRAQLQAADCSLIEQQHAACCDASSNKYGVTDPAGVDWDTFRTLDCIPSYGAEIASAPQQQVSAPCCVPQDAPSERCCSASKATESCCT